MEDNREREKVEDNNREREKSWMILERERGVVEDGGVKCSEWGVEE